MIGYPKQAIEFYKALDENNNREWFLDHKQDYINYVQEPSIEFVLDIGPKLQKIIPNIQYDTLTNGSGSIMRIYRDTRFSKDKKPYKTWHGVRFWEGDDKKNCASRFFFYINAEGGGLYVGSHHFEKTHLLRYQQGVMDTNSGPELERIIKKLGKHYELGGEQYKRVPKAFPPDHVRGDLLKYKALYAHYGELSMNDVTSNNLTKCVMTHFKKLAPLHIWLCNVIQK